LSPYRGAEADEFLLRPAPLSKVVGVYRSDLCDEVTIEVKDDRKRTIEPILMFDDHTCLVIDIVSRGSAKKF
jgi:hypothetical protein